MAADTARRLHILEPRLLGGNLAQIFRAEIVEIED